MKTKVPETFSRYRIAIHAHVFYPELWPELRGSIQNFIDVCGSSAVGVYVTYPESKPDVELMLKSDIAITKIVKVGNYGYDIAPFFKVIDGLNLDDFDYLVKLHTKRDTPKCWVNFRSWRGGEWRRCLLSFCSTSLAVEKSLRALEHIPRLGMVAARPFVDPSGYGAGRHPEQAAELVTSLGIPIKGRTIVYGTMFMVRAKLLKPAWKKVCQADFGGIVPGHEHDEFGLAGKWEGAFGMLVESQGYYVSDGAYPMRLDQWLLQIKKIRLRTLRVVSDGTRSLLGNGIFTKIVNWCR